MPIANVTAGTVTTYNPNVNYFISTTAATYGAVVYAVEAGVGNVGGITNAPPAGQYYDGITHFKNVSGKAGHYIGDPGNEIPLSDKQGVVALNLGSVSAGTFGFVVPYTCTIAGYWTQLAVAPAVPGAVTVAVGSAGAGLLTLTTVSAGTVGDVYAFALGTGNTGGVTTVSAGSPVFVSLVASGTAFAQAVTLILTRCGL